MHPLMRVKMEPPDSFDKAPGNRSRGVPWEKRTGTNTEAHRDNIHRLRGKDSVDGGVQQRGGGGSGGGEPGLHLAAP